MAASSSESQQQEHRFSSNIYIAFVDWLLFSVITMHAEVRALRAGRPKALELGAIVAFVAFTIVALTAGDETLE